MKNYRKIILLITCFTFIILYESKAQLQPSGPVSIIGKWKDDQDPKSIWEFKTDGKLYATYVGHDFVNIYVYKIYEPTDTPPVCPDAQLSTNEGLKFLQLINAEDGNIKCFYIYGLTSNRLTVMNAVTGLIFPSVKI